RLHQVLDVRRHEFWSGIRFMSTEALARQFPEPLNDVYRVEAFVGQGAFSTVWRATHRTSGQVRAIKKIDTTDLSPREIAHEIAIMRFLRHENVVRCYDVFLENQFVSVVMDLFNGGDLVDGLNLHRRASGRLRNKQLRHLAKQMTAAVAHVHSLEIMHRDVKGENFLSDRPNIADPHVRVALSDFGTAIRVDRGEKVYTRVGTPAFWAPEIFVGAYDFKVDVWALGVTTYILLCGTLPYDGQEEICRRPGPEEPLVTLPPHTTKACQEFLEACLVKDSETRRVAKEVQTSEWFQREAEDSPMAAEKEEAPKDKFRDLLEGLTVTCCGAIKLCLDYFCDEKQVEAAAARWSKASTKSSGKDVFEKQATDLSKQISTSLLQHQDSLRH
ncbi:unnamed protein product, partial [Durusdinium trenchii]